MHFVNCDDFWDIDSNFYAIYLIYIIIFFFFSFFLPLVFLGFLIYPGSEPLAGDSQTRCDLRAPDEKTSLGLKDSSKQGHKTKRDYFIFVHRFKCE